MGGRDDSDSNGDNEKRKCLWWHSINQPHRTIGNFSLQAASQGPEAMSHHSASCLSAHFWESTEIDMFYRTNLDCHLAHTFSWHGPKASTAILPSKQNPEFSRTKSGAEMLQAQRQFITAISNFSSGCKTINMNNNWIWVLAVSTTTCDSHIKC